jgi:hypothetical protein
MAFWDELGETLNGITQTVATAGQSYINGWTEAQVDTMKSSIPEQNRTAEDPALQPTGELVAYGAAQNTQQLLVYGVWGLALIGLVIAFKK